MYGQVAIARLLSARFFNYCDFTAAWKRQTCLVRSLSAGQFRGIGGLATNKRSPLFVQKDTACH